MGSDRDRAIALLYKRGASIERLAADFYVGTKAIRNALERAGVVKRSRRESIIISWGTAKRNKKIVKLVSSGCSFSDVASRLKMSRSAVAGVVWRHNRHQVKTHAA